MGFVFTAVVAVTISLPQAAAQSALLVGLHLDDSGDAPSYRTFLITFDDGKAQLAADIPDLIVPRKNGFWRVGTLDKDVQKFVYAAPARAVPHALGEYHPPNPEYNCSNGDESTIEFVNSDLISVSYLHEPACSLEVELKHETYKLDDLGRPLDIADALGPAAWEAEKKADSAAKSEERKAQRCPLLSKPDPRNWAVESTKRSPHRSAKTWTLVGNYNAGHVCNGGADYEIKFPVPQSIAGVQYHADALRSLLKSNVAEKNRIRIDDSLLTPDGNFLITFNGDIQIFQVENHTIQGAPTVSVPNDKNPIGNFNVVMIQWALGKHVAEWEAELKAIAASKLPEPVVDVGEMQK